MRHYRQPRMQPITPPNRPTARFRQAAGIALLGLLILAMIR